MLDVHCDIVDAQKIQHLRCRGFPPCNDLCAGCFDFGSNVRPIGVHQCDQVADYWRFGEILEPIFGVAAGVAAQATQPVGRLIPCLLYTSYGFTYA